MWRLHMERENIKELKISIPDGYTIDYESSTFECIKFKPKKLTYEKIAKELFESKETFWTTSYGVVSCNCDGVKAAYADATNCTSEKQVHKLLAINKLMNVAKYLNGNWKPNWNDQDETKCCITVDSANKLTVDYTIFNRSSVVYFKTGILAKQAINILGEDTIRLALSTDW